MRSSNIPKPDGKPVTVNAMSFAVGSIRLKEEQLQIPLAQLIPQIFIQPSMLSMQKRYTFEAICLNFGNVSAPSGLKLFMEVIGTDE